MDIVIYSSKKSRIPGSSPGGATIMTRFKYNNREYETFNVKKTLRKMGITLKDIEILPDKKIEIKNEVDNSIQLYYFKNIKTGYTITSIYDNLDNLKHIKDINDYERIQ